MCLSLEHQDPSKTSEKWVILIALQFRYTSFRPQTKRLRARKIGLQYKNTDVVPNMTPEALIMRSLRHFTARRGLPAKIISDNGLQPPFKQR